MSKYFHGVYAIKNQLKACKMPPTSVGFSLVGAKVGGSRGTKLYHGRREGEWQQLLIYD